MRFVISCLLFTAAIIAGCKKDEVLNIPELRDYYPLAVGKTFTYRMDSIKIAPFGVKLDTVYYLAKDTVENKFIDAMGRESYRIFRFIKDTLPNSTQPWRFAATYVASFSSDRKSLEYLDNNLRYLILRQPLTEGSSWKGNTFIDTKSANSPVKFLDEWEYQLENVNGSFSVRKGTFDSTITILQQDETIPPGTFNPAFYQQRNYSTEVYAKGVGLIYKYFLHWTWQTNGGGRFDDDSYGVRLNLIDYK
jgi:hypothetical protein